jgi:predicted ABC-type ATPase
LNQLKNTLKKPVLVIVRGVPGSGKTYFAELLEKALGKDICVNLDPDATDYNSQEYKDHVQEQIKEGVDTKLHPYRFLRAKAYKAILEGKVIIWNQPFTDLAIMKKVTDRLEEYSKLHQTQLSILVLEVIVPKEVAWERIAKRVASGGHGPSEGRFTQFFKQYQSASPGGYECVSIDGLADNSEIVGKIADKLKSNLSGF